MQKKDLKFVFFGTPDVASETLEILKQNGYLPELIITAPDKPAGRKMILTPPPVKTWAIENNIPFVQPEDLKEGANVVFRNIAQADGPSIAIRQQVDMRDFQKNILLELFIVVAYGKILPDELIKIPKLGSINIHYSLLPKYRGASPVESAILNGDTETGISIQQMEYKMDSGPIIAQEKVVIDQNETAPELRKRLIKIGGELLVKILDTNETPTLLPLTNPPTALREVPKAEGVWNITPQNESQATYCKKIKKEDGLIDLNADPIINYNKFRAYANWPRTYFFSAKGGSASGGKENKRIIITDAKLENNKFVIKKIIPESGKEIEYKN